MVYIDAPNFLLRCTNQVLQEAAVLQAQDHTATYRFPPCANEPQTRTALCNNMVPM